MNPKDIDLLNDDLKYDSCDFDNSSDSTETETTKTDSSDTNTNNIDTIDTVNTINLDDLNFTNETDEEIFISTTTMHEDHIIVTQTCHDLKTGDLSTAEFKFNLDHFNANEKTCHFGLDLHSNPQQTSNTFDNFNESNKRDDFHNHLSSSAEETHKQEIENNHAMRTKNIRINTSNSTSQGRLHITLTTDGFNNALLSPKFKEQFITINNSEQYRCQEKMQSFTRKTTQLEMQSEQNFRDAVLELKVTQLTKLMKHPNFSIATEALAELKKMWICPRKNMFLGPESTYSNRERNFIVKSLLGINIIRNAEREFITRPDYIAAYADPQSLKKIQKHQKLCLLLQQKGDRSSLCNEASRLARCIDKNGKKDDFATNICYAITLETLLNPITDILSTVSHVPSMETARNTLQHFKNQLVEQAEQNNIVLKAEFKEWIIKQYGFDALAAAHDCYISRPDYINEPTKQAVFSSPILSIFNIIEHRTLPIAHSELIHLKKQVIEGLESLNVTDPVKQKEFIVAEFGSDIIERAQKLYTNRSDYKRVSNAFIPIDVQNSSINILSNHHDYASVGHAFDIMAEHVFHNARLCKLDYVPEVEAHVMDSLHIIKAPRNDAEFVFNVTIVDHVLTDIQSQMDGIVKGETPVLDRIPELFSRAVEKFINGLNPVTQVTSLGELLATGVYTLSVISDDILDQALHPNIMDQKNLDLKVQFCESLISTARFTADLIIGDTYLSKEEYLQRHATFWKDYGSKITAENVVDLTAQVLADFVFFKGIPSAFIYLKEIDAASKLENQAAKIANRFKHAADTHLANNPILVTAEGVALQMSNDLKNIGSIGKEIITDSRMFIESIQTGLLSNFKQELDGLKNVFGYTREGFAEFKNQKIKLPYEHIFTLEGLEWSKKGKISRAGGFHHDFKGAVKNSGAVQFIERGVEKNGCYLADLVIDGSRIPNKTFFPQHWPREEVVRKIGEAYDDFIKSGAIVKRETGGKYIISGFTNEGIEIEMYITKNGQITTAYPIVEARI